jgi:hypothetical protein
VWGIGGESTVVRADDFNYFLLSQERMIFDLIAENFAVADCLMKERRGKVADPDISNLSCLAKSLQCMNRILE